MSKVTIDRLRIFLFGKSVGKSSGKGQKKAGKNALHTVSSSSMLQVGEKKAGAKNKKTSIMAKNKKPHNGKRKAPVVETEEDNDKEDENDGGVVGVMARKSKDAAQELDDTLQKFMHSMGE